MSSWSGDSRRTTGPGRGEVTSRQLVSRVGIMETTQFGAEFVAVAARAAFSGEKTTTNRTMTSDGL